MSNWKSEGTKATAERKAYFERLVELLDVPGCTVELELDTIDKTWRGANLRVLYPGLYLDELPAMLSGNVRLEVGSARVTPYVTRALTSWVHDKLAATNTLTAFDDNRPCGVRCVHPLVTLLEKLDALHRRFPNAKAPPQTFVRHYEDAARLVDASAKLPPLDDYANVRALADEMLAQKQLATMPSADDAALVSNADARWDGIRGAHAALQGMFWGPRLTVEQATETIRAWIALNLTSADAGA